MPVWFRIPSPLGTYNPDWAMAVEEAGAQRLYLVRETKGGDGLFTGDLRRAEGAKIRCGERHFAGIGVLSEWGV